MKAAVVILNWNTVQQLRDFLPALAASCPQWAGVIVADNGSTDGSLEYVAEAFPHIPTIRLGGNLGFTGGYNAALAQIDAEYFVLINSDVYVCPGWLEPLVDYMDAHPECGVCGPKIHALEKERDGRWVRSARFEYAGAAGGYIDRFGYPFCRGRVMQRTEEDCGQYDSSPPLMWISGACMLTRTSLWQRLNGLDGRFFAHMEEIDYCWRAQLAGFGIRLVPQSTVWHAGGGTLSRTSPQKTLLNYRNNLLMLQNNLPATVGRASAGRIIFMRKVLDGCSAIVYLLTGRVSLFRAVIAAHRQAAKMKRPPCTRTGAQVSGYWKICIILQSLARGEKVFKYLRDYENSH